MSGSVSDAVTGAPIRKAAITLRFKQEVRTAATDASGRFQISNLTPGEYRITAVARGYLRLENEPTAAAARSIVFGVAAGHTVDGIVLRLTPAAAISGRILDEDNDPISGVPVQLWAVRYPNGQRELAAVHQWRAATDDRGMYRIADVAPGDYYISVFHRNGLESSDTPLDDLRYVRAFYPGGTDGTMAAPVHLPGGAEMENVNWRVAKVQTVRVSGRLIGGTGYFSNLIPDGPLARNDSALSSKVEPDGSFEFSGVLPGSYTLAVGGEDDQNWAFRPVTVGPAGVLGLTVALVPRIRLEGRVRVEGDVEADLSQLRIVLSSLSLVNFVETSQSPAKDGSFTWERIIPGRFRLGLFGLRPGFYLKSVRLGNQTLPDGAPLDFTTGGAPVLDLLVSPAAAQVTGVVISTESSLPASDALVVLVPDDSARQGDVANYAHTSTDQAGRFQLSNVSPGSYRAYAVHPVRDNLFMDPKFRQRHEEHSVALAVAEGGQASLKLRLKR